MIVMKSGGTSVGDAAVRRNQIYLCVSVFICVHLW
jgi:hypothetical protein